MKLSKETINILMNFAKINSGIIFPEGNQIKTISFNDATMAEATIAESFPKEFAIADLNKFVSLQTLFAESPELVFGDEELTIEHSNTKLTYRYSNPKVVKSRKAPIVIPEPVISFSLSTNEVKSLNKTSALLQLSSLSVNVASDGVTTVTVQDLKDSSLGSFTIKLNADKFVTGKVIISLENMTLLDGDYQVEISVKQVGDVTVYVAVFTNLTSKVKYYIACEDGSKIY